VDRSTVIERPVKARENGSNGKEGVELVFAMIAEKGTWRKAQEDAGKMRYDESLIFTSLAFSGITGIVHFNVDISQLSSCISRFQIDINK
jgi:hypothetical protein